MRTLLGFWKKLFTSFGPRKKRPDRLNIRNGEKVISACIFRENRYKINT
jgi:hypothetical protein